MLVQSLKPPSYINNNAKLSKVRLGTALPLPGAPPTFPMQYTSDDMDSTTTPSFVYLTFCSSSSYSRVLVPTNMTGVLTEKKRALGKSIWRHGCRNIHTAHDLMRVKEGTFCRAEKWGTYLPTSLVTYLNYIPRWPR